MNEFIKIEKDFQTSINLAYDINNDNKVNCFIPTKPTLEIISDILLSVSRPSTQRARIFIGAYGRGKSHIILVLLSFLLTKDENKFHLLLNKIKTNDLVLYDYLRNFINNGPKLLPIIVRGSSKSLIQSFLSALQQTLSLENLSDFMPNTYFEAVVNQIKVWQHTYPETFSKFKNLVSKSTDDFILSLEEYNVNSYDEFVKLYPELTSGSTFNPFFGFDVAEIYSNVAEKLKEKGFDGIYVVYDEFSKYLESSIATTSNSDIKLLQDFAEKCNRSKNTQMHLMLISHKDISNYIDNNLPKDKVDGWRGVSGRFKHMSLHNNYSQIYEIIANVINKDETIWKNFINKYRDNFLSLKNHYTKNNHFSDFTQNEIDLIVEGCYPLHPLSTFILPRLSEKIAQNERTLFTFLSSEEPFTLSYFLNQTSNSYCLLTPDYIYDYFEPLLRKEQNTGEIYKTYKLANSVLRRLENKPLHSKIVKTIALIYFVEQFEKLSPLVNVITDIFKYFYDSKEIHTAIKELIENDCVVYLKRSNNFLKLKETSGENIEEEVTKYIQQKLYNKSLTDILNSSFFDGFMYPTAYNDNNEIIRYFDFHFIDAQEYRKTNNWKQKISEHTADGVIYAVIPNSQDDIEKLEQELSVQTKFHRRIVFVIPKNFTNINKCAFEYAAAINLREEAVGDEILFDEYDLLVQDLSEILGNYYNDFSRPENENAYYFYCGKKLVFNRKAQLSNFLSQICTEVFNKTPIINNEAANKIHLTTTAINSRNKILASLLSGELSHKLGLSGSGQEVSIMRSTLVQTKIFNDDPENPAISLTPPDKNMREMLSKIYNFFTNDASKPDGANFKSLYDILTLPENGFGLKLGVIPIYIAVVLHSCKNNTVILYKQNEVKITPDLLNEINNNPQDYSVKLENWNNEKSIYTQKLENLFSNFVKQHEKNYNTFTYLLNAIQNWYLSLPKYAKELKTVFDSYGSPCEVSLPSRKFINALRQPNINPREFLFDKTFSIYDFKDFDSSIIENIEDTKRTYDSAIQNLMSALIFKTKKMFYLGKTEISLSSAIKDWVENLKPATLQNLFPGNENDILKVMTNINNNENEFIEKLAKAVSFLRLEDWNNETIERYMSDLEKFKRTIESFNSLNKQNFESTASYEIIFTDNTGKKEPKRFTKAPYSNKAKLLLNEMTSQLEEYGQSITEQEKRQVLIELLEKLCY